MSHSKSKETTRYRSKGNLADRYQVSSRTIDRWRGEPRARSSSSQRVAEVV
jgi:hypothetical protein